MFDSAEALARWARVRKMMAANDLDVVLAIDCSPDETLHASLRWLTGFIARDPAAALLHRDGHVELLSGRVGITLKEYYKARKIPLELVSGCSPAILAERVERWHPKRVGIAEPEYLSASFAKALLERLPSIDLVDSFADFLALRLRKSPYEVNLVRRSCAIADAVWEHVAEIFKIGRKNYEIVADIDRLVKLEGAESGFHLLQRLPFQGRPLTLLVNEEPIEANRRYTMEISPRFEGYYSQLTIPVTTYAKDELVLRAHQDLTEAKRAVQPRMTPSADLSEVARFVDHFLAERGHRMTSHSLGHFCGLALNEPRHDPKSSFILDENMTLIFHPVLADRELEGLLRADTYLITATGAEKLNRFEKGVLAVG